MPFSKSLTKHVGAIDDIEKSYKAHFAAGVVLKKMNWNTTLKYCLKLRRNEYVEFVTTNFLTNVI